MPPLKMHKDQTALGLVSFCPSMHPPFPAVKWPRVVHTFTQTPFSPHPGRAESTAHLHVPWHIPPGSGMQLSQTTNRQLLLQVPQPFVPPRSSELPRRLQLSLSNSCHIHACWGTQAPELCSKSPVTHILRNRCLSVLSKCVFQAMRDTGAATA